MQIISHYVNIIKYQVHDSVAQLDRAFDYESKGQGFESLLGHQTKGAVTKQPLKSKKLLVDYMKSTNNFFVFLSKKGPEGPFSLV